MPAVPDHVVARLGELTIETPSWGYGDSGTRFGVFPQPGRPRDVWERVDDAAEVHRLTATAGAVALHFPWDAVDDPAELRRHIESRGLRVGAVNPNLFQDPDYKLGSLTHPDAAVREQATAHMLECIEIATALGSTAQSLWLADGTNYPGQDDLRARRRRLLGCLEEVYAALPEEQELLVEYKFFEPAFYATDLADWGSAVLACMRLGARARVLVDLGHHAQGTNVEQIVAFLAEEGRLGGFHFNNRKYADDDLIVGSVNPFELFLIFTELVATDGAAAAADDRPVAQRRAEGRGDGAERRQPAGGVREGAARRRGRAARRAGGRRRARRPRAAARRLPHRRPPAVRAGARRPRRRRGPRRRAARLRLRRPGGRRTRSPGDHPMSTLTPLIDEVDDLWPAGAEPPADLLDELVLASHLLGANRAVSNFGGGNTSAKGTAIDHAGREVPVMWVKGSGSDLATMGREHFTGLRLDEVLPLIERDAMSDEEMVAYLARCQLDPAMPRCSIETLLHAFVPAPHVHHTHPDGINVLAGTADGERLVRECFGDEAAWIPYIRPGFTLSKQVGEAARANPDLKLVVLAKHGLVVWGDTAEEAYRRTIEVINRAVAFVNERTRDAERFGGSSPGRVPEAERAALLRELLPAIRGAVSSERPKVLIADTSARPLEFVASAQAERLVTVGAPCPDHLVHTKRVPLWIPYDPDADDADALRARIAERADAFRADYRAYVDAYGDADTEPADPDAADRARPARRARRGRHDDEERAHRARPLPPRDRGDGRRRGAGRVRVARRRGELRDRVLAARALQARAGAAARRAAGRGRARHRRRGRDRARDRGRAARRRRLRRRVRPRPGRAPTRRWPSSATTGSRSAATSRARTRCGPRSPPRSSASAASTSSSRTPGVASSAALEDTSLDEWRRNHEILVTGYFLVAREAFTVLKRQGRGGSVVFVASKNALVAGKNAAAYSSAKAAELHLARCLAEEGGADGIRVNTVNPDAVLQGSRIWDSSWREERAAAYGIEPDELEEHYRKRTTLRREHLPRGHRPGRAALRLAGALRARAPATCSTWTAACRRRTRADP